MPWSGNGPLPRASRTPGRHLDEEEELKVVLAYSGGLDTSVILAWLREEHGAEVIAYTADVGQGAEVGEAKVKALATGAVEAVVEDLTRSFRDGAVFPALRAAAVYEGHYLLGPPWPAPSSARAWCERPARSVPTPSRTVRPARETIRSGSSSPLPRWPLISR